MSKNFRVKSSLYLDLQRLSGAVPGKAGKAAAAAAVRRHYKGLTWLGRARCAGGAPAIMSKNDELAT